MAKTLPKRQVRIEDAPLPRTRLGQQMKRRGPKCVPESSPSPSKLSSKSQTKLSPKPSPPKKSLSKAKSPKKTAPRIVVASPKQKNVKGKPPSRAASRKVPHSSGDTKRPIVTGSKKSVQNPPVTGGPASSLVPRVSTRGSPHCKSSSSVTYSRKRGSPVKTFNDSLLPNNPESPLKRSRKTLDLPSSPSKSQGKIHTGSDFEIPKIVVESSHQEQLNERKIISGTTLPSDPVLSGRFIRKKWFSLKSHGGFSCLRSAILTPEEIAKEVIEHTMVDRSKDKEANFFTTKLMVRLSSRLPPARARPSCEELVNMTKPELSNGKLNEPKKLKGEGTAIRVKVERRSFKDTLSHVNPVKSVSHQASPKSPMSHKRASGRLSKKEERQVALQQLKNLKYL